MSHHFDETISDKTRAASAMIGGQHVLSSDAAGWKSLHLKVVSWSPLVDDFEYRPTPDPVIVLVVGRGGLVECAQSGRWRRMNYDEGTGCVIGGGNAGRVRWNLPSHKTLKLAYAYIPRSMVERVALELSDAGLTHSRDMEDLRYFDRTSVSSTIRALFPAMRSGASEFLAQTAAQWLTLQFLVTPPALNSTAKLTQTFSDVRLARVLEYMEARLSEPLSLEALAKEAGVSRFHFIGLFRKALGKTPHKHLLELRIKVAASMLLQESKGVLEVALACGFRSPSHFAAVFKQRYDQSPTEYRLRYTSPKSLAFTA